MSVRLSCALIPVILLCGCNPDSDEGPRRADGPGPEGAIRTSGGPKLSSPPLLSQQARRLPKSGYEDRNGLDVLEWQIADCANPGQAIHVNLGQADSGTAKSVRLAIELFGGPAYATALRCEGAWALRIDRKAETVLVVYNAMPAAIQGSLAYTLSDRYIWHESPAFVLKPGWNTVRVKQGAADFKTRHTNWQHRARIRRPNACYCITIQFHNGRRTGRLFIDYVAVAGTPVELPPVPSQLPK